MPTSNSTVLIDNFLSSLVGPPRRINGTYLQLISIKWYSVRGDVVGCYDKCKQHYDDNVDTQTLSMLGFSQRSCVISQCASVISTLTGQQIATSTGRINIISWLEVDDIAPISNLLALFWRFPFLSDTSRFCLPRFPRAPVYLQAFMSLPFPSLIVYPLNVWWFSGDWNPNLLGDNELRRQSSYSTSSEAR